MGSFTRSAVAVAFGLALVACSTKATTKPPASTCDPVVEDVGVAARTTGAAAKTGVVAAADGVVQAGSATAGLVQDGTEGARTKWKARGAETKQEARANADETKREAHRRTCK